MRNLMALAFVLVGTSGCVIYESDCGGDFDGDGFCDGPDLGDDFNDVDGDGIPDDEQPDNGVTLKFFPPTAEQGEVFLASITIEEGEIDLREASDLRFYGDVELVVWGARANEITATMSVDDEAVEGEVDLVVEFADGTAELVPAALTIFAKDSGHSADDWSNGGPADDGDCE
ncbi:MAG: hypothetical protein H6739_03790 [Alphaproteobacteria bacterium]|nr:hypothetical protein [Alphaproteobacteria bacterium]